MTSVDKTATSAARTRIEPDGRAYLLVVEGDSSSLFHLPRDGTIVIGRASEAELRLTHGSVSRRHATIRIDGGVAQVADLESHNGTRVNGEAVTAARTLSSGDVVAVGDVLLVVHTTIEPALTRAVLAEASWRRRLAEELERALTYRRSLAVFAIDDVAIGDLTPEISDALRLIDVIGRGENGQLLVLLPESERAAALDAARRLADVLPPTARLGVATCPADAVDADAIVFSARSAARAAAPRGIAHPADTVERIDLGSRSVLVADPAMSRLYALLERVAASTLPVLITGETGVGKENAAFAVHHWSKRREGPFVVLDCSAIPPTLIESQLFGHEKGAFTGAHAARAGVFEQARGGTVFLDEIGELPLEMQPRLLRALEERVIRRIGAAEPTQLDVRLVAATNRSLEDECRAGRFRQDLLYRLQGARVILPPLRDRQCEIPILARELLAQACARDDRAPLEITPAAMQVLLTHEWTGNVRELRQAMDFAAVAAPDAFVEPSDLPPHITGAPGSISAAMTAISPPVDVADPTEPPVPSASSFRAIADELRELERRRMVEALAATGGVKSRAAQLIDMPIRTFTLKAKQYKL